jgi:hypothetical protein
VRHVFVLTADRRTDLVGRPLLHVHPTISMTQSSNTMTADRNYRTIMTCYHCGDDAHIKPRCPKLKEKITPKVVVPKDKDEKAYGEAGEPKARDPLAAWKKICPSDLTKPH